MTDPVREALAELLDAHARNTLFSGGGHWDRARAALAQPEPAALSDGEIVSAARSAGFRIATLAETDILLRVGRAIERAVRGQP